MNSTQAASTAALRFAARHSVKNNHRLAAAAGSATKEGGIGVRRFAPFHSWASAATSMATSGITSFRLDNSGKNSDEGSLLVRNHRQNKKLQQQRSFVTATGPRKNVWYTATHEIYQLVNQVAQVGISPYAAGQLGEIVFLDLPAPGTVFNAGDRLGTLEAVKAAADFYAPVDGMVQGVNTQLATDIAQGLEPTAEQLAELVTMEVSGSPAGALDCPEYVNEINLQSTPEVWECNQDGTIKKLN